MTLRYHTPLSPEEQTAAGLPAPWPFAIADRVRWGELDQLGHVNNAAYMVWFETARIRYFAERGVVGPEAGHVTVIRRGEIDWLAEMRGEPDYVVTVRCTEIRRTSFTLESELWSEGRCTARFRCVIVLIAADRSGKVALPEALRRRFIEADGATEG
ncbi:acyl-CoA thioesterase [Rhodosalinus sediminis]|uniref:Acyl-CoA thioesterase n=1 Tax=Rhodosalinus sediminis TaxID=1940533 RepID=A0A3D9BT03_9RHOB|nr:thioesterase family protein [Rhodosalinus sediminis]REC56650.1 acyl-CoA thioesterase [Rhodosalinus sediminis]